MASKFKDFVDDFPGGWVVGIGAVLLSPIVAPMVAKAGKPLAKAAIKNGLRLYEESKGAIAEAGEVLEDWIAEAQAELAEERQQEDFFDDYTMVTEPPAEPSVDITATTPPGASEE